MKVLKHGNTTRLTATCPHCGCEFEFLETEAIAGWSPKDLYIHCPECHDVVREVHFKEPSDGNENRKYNPRKG